MPDEIPRLLDAWARREVSPAKVPLLGRSPSSAYLAAARRARLIRRGTFTAAVIAGAALLVLVVVWLVPRDMATTSAPSSAPSAPPLRAMDR